MPMKIACTLLVSLLAPLEKIKHDKATIQALSFFPFSLIRRITNGARFNVCRFVINPL